MIPVFSFISITPESCTDLTFWFITLYWITDQIIYRIDSLIFGDGRQIKKQRETKMKETNNNVNSEVLIEGMRNDFKIATDDIF